MNITSYSSMPEQIFRLPHFIEPLVPISEIPDDLENNALICATEKYIEGGVPENDSPITNFLKEFPASSWRASLYLNLGLNYFRTGQYSKTIGAFNTAWKLSKGATEIKHKAIADRAFGELVYMHARVGNMEELEELLNSVEGRVFSGVATEKLCGAREGLWSMKNRPEISFCCGPYALRKLIKNQPQHQFDVKPIKDAASNTKGFSLSELEDLSREVGLNFKMAFRKQNVPFIIPSVIHLKVNHYAALIKEENNLFLLEDSTFRKDVWVTKQVLEQEASGYFLVSENALTEGWDLVSKDEGDLVYGKGYIGSGPPPPNCGDHSTASICKFPCPEGDGGGGAGSGMATAQIKLAAVSLSIDDTPISYQSPLGPTLNFAMHYKQRVGDYAFDANVSNVGINWTFDWLSFILVDDIHEPAKAQYYKMGGGVRYFDDLSNNSFPPQLYDQTILTKNDANEYTMQSGDGYLKTFNRVKIINGIRKVYLTKITDPQGNKININYDPNELRILSLTVTAADDQNNLNPIGLVMYIKYNGQGPQGDIIGNGDIFKIVTVGICDPAQTTYEQFINALDPSSPVNSVKTTFFDYKDKVHLTSIKDAVGIISQFTYEPGGGDFIQKLTTPYGDTLFSKVENGVYRSVEITYPDKSKERVEFNQATPNYGASDYFEGIPFSDVVAPDAAKMYNFNQYLYYRNTYHWDRKASAEAYGDYSKAKIYHWLHADVNTYSGILESVKSPLENRIWYDYDGQKPSGANPQDDRSLFIGTTNKPKRIGRVLDDGNTQLYTYEYNALGNVTKMTDPHLPTGRTTNYYYADNNIDLIKVTQTEGGQEKILSITNYNGQHLSSSTTDASGQTTSFEYNKWGKIAKKKDALGNATLHIYGDRNGNADADQLNLVNPYLVEVRSPLGASTKFTYDVANRVRTKTDESGYILTFDYDALDRLIKITYPDTSSTQYNYTNANRPLNVDTIFDRAGRGTSFEYDSLGQMISRTDKNGLTTYFQWCKCGALKSITDPMGRTTMWRHDIQGRVMSKEYPDGSLTQYIYENSTSRLSKKIDEQGQITQYTYNVDNTVSQRSYTNTVNPTPTVSFTYDPDYNRMLSIIDGNGTTAYTYVANMYDPNDAGSGLTGSGQILRETNSFLNTRIEYGYDALGRTISKTIDGSVTKIAYDEDGRKTGETNALGHFGISYEDVSNRIRLITYPKTEFSMLQDERNVDVVSIPMIFYSYLTKEQDFRLSKIRNGLIFYKEAAAYFNRFESYSIHEYTYDIGKEQITSWSQKKMSPIYSNKAYQDININFTYDEENQLKTASQADNLTHEATVCNYNYDNAGNRVSEQINDATNTYYYNCLNELVTESVDTGETASYQWDAESRLISIVKNNQTTNFLYDALGRRIRISNIAAGITTNRYFLWANSEIVEELSEPGVVSKRYFENGVKIESGNKQGKYFYTKDHLGSIRELIDSAGKIRASYRYDAFGRQIKLAGDFLSDSDTDFGFAGMFYCHEVGLNLTWYRAYNPNNGRWLSRDVLTEAEQKEGANLFTYAHNDPINKYDTLGLCCESEYINFMTAVTAADTTIAAAMIQATLTCRNAFIAARLGGPTALLTAEIACSAALASVALLAGGLAAGVAYLKYKLDECLKTCHAPTPPPEPTCPKPCDAFDPFCKSS